MKNSLEITQFGLILYIFLAGIYAFIIGTNFVSIKLTNNWNDLKFIDKYKCIIFYIFGILLFCTGIASIVYHLHTPSYKKDSNAINTKEFKTSLKLDQTFASISGIFALIIFIFQLIIFHYCSTNKKNIIKHPIFRDGNFYLSILFIILSIIFYVIAGGHHSHAIDCDDNNCFSENIDAYDIFHSNWHIFTSLAAIFWITMINNSFSWKYSK